MLPNDAIYVKLNHNKVGKCLGAWLFVQTLDATEIKIKAI